jgi:hypothetical protein
MVHKKSGTLKIPQTVRGFRVLIPKRMIFGLLLFLERKKLGNRTCA